MSKRKICTNDPKKNICTQNEYMSMSTSICVVTFHILFLFLLFSFLISLLFATLCCFGNVVFLKLNSVYIVPLYFYCHRILLYFCSMLHSIQKYFFRISHFSSSSYQSNTQTKICIALIEIISDSMFSNFFRQIMYSSHSVFLYASK